MLRSCSPRCADPDASEPRAVAKGGQGDEARAVLARFRAVGSQSGNLIPQPGIVELLGLSPEQQQARYRDQVRKRLKEDPQNADLNLRYVEVLTRGRQSAGGCRRRRSPTRTEAVSSSSRRDRSRAGQRRRVQRSPFPCSNTPHHPSSTAGVELDLAIAMFHTDGDAHAALAKLDQSSGRERSGDYYLARAQALDAASKPEEA